MKFEDDMEKLPENSHDTDAVLELAYLVQRKDLPRAFIEYDTKFRGKDGHYKLPHDGTYILCFYRHARSGAPFTTLRTFDTRKLEAYRKNVGQVYRIWIESLAQAGEQKKLTEGGQPLEAAAALPEGARQ